MNESSLANFTPEIVCEAFRSAITTALWELAECEAFIEMEAAEPGSEADETVVMATMRLTRSEPGGLTLYAPASLAEKLASRYLPSGTTLATDIVDDVVGEFANVIGGQAKTALKLTPYHFLLSLPIVTRLSPEATRASRTSSCEAPGSEHGRDALFTLRVETEFGRMIAHVHLPYCPDQCVEGGTSVGG